LDVGPYSCNLQLIKLGFIVMPKDQRNIKREETCSIKKVLAAEDLSEMTSSMIAVLEVKLQKHVVENFLKVRSF
jgi:hypothetical protein